MSTRHTLTSLLGIGLSSAGARQCLAVMASSVLEMPRRKGREFCWSWYFTNHDEDSISAGLVITDSAEFNGLAQQREQHQHHVLYWTEQRQASDLEDCASEDTFPSLILAQAEVTGAAIWSQQGSVLCGKYGQNCCSNRSDRRKITRRVEIARLTACHGLRIHHTNRNYALLPMACCLGA